MAPNGNKTRAFQNRRHRAGATAIPFGRLMDRASILLVPTIVLLLLFLIFPILNVLVESLRPHEAGRIGGTVAGTLTLENYIDFASSTYVAIFADTFLLSVIAALLATGLGFPLAAVIALSEHLLLRRVILSVLVAALFLNTITRVYSLAVTLGPAGIGREVSQLFGVSINAKEFIKASVIAGLVHFNLPIAALTMVGTVRNLNPRLLEAATSLGASRVAVHVTITVPLCARGMASAFAIAWTIGLSSFVVPFVLGKGRVEFVANLIYRRFSELANYPSGSALAVLLLLAALAVLWIASMATGMGGQGAGRES